MSLGLKGLNQNVTCEVLLFQVPFYHVLFEAVLVIWIVRLLMSKTFRFREQEIELTEKVKWRRE